MLCKEVEWLLSIYNASHHKVKQKTINKKHAHTNQTHLQREIVFDCINLTSRSVFDLLMNYKHMPPENIAFLHDIILNWERKKTVFSAPPCSSPKHHVSSLYASSGCLNRQILYCIGCTCSAFWHWDTNSWLPAGQSRSLNHKTQLIAEISAPRQSHSRLQQIRKSKITSGEIPLSRKEHNCLSRSPPPPLFNK